MYHYNNPPFPLQGDDCFIGMDDAGSSVYQQYGDLPAGYDDPTGIYGRVGGAGMDTYPAHADSGMPALRVDANLGGYGSYYGSYEQYGSFEDPGIYPSAPPPLAQPLVSSPGPLFSPSSMSTPLPSPLPSQQKPPKPYRCGKGHCTAAFQHMKDLRRHRKTVHSTGDEPYFRCRCDKRDTRKDNYLRHLEKCGRVHVHTHYMCSCGHLCADKEQHRVHVTGCRHGFGKVGRPNAS